MVVSMARHGNPFTMNLEEILKIQVPLLAHAVIMKGIFNTIEILKIMNENTFNFCQLAMNIYTTFTIFRFLLPYERHTRAKEERKKKKKGDQDKVTLF